MVLSVDFSGNVKRSSQKICKYQIWKTYHDMPFGSQILCHISDRQTRYSGALFIILPNGFQFSAHSIAKDPLDVVDNLISSIENQMACDEQKISPPVLQKWIQSHHHR